MDHSTAAHGLGHKSKAKEKPAPKKHLKEFHAKELHDGTFHTAAHDGKGGVQEGSAPDVDSVHDALEAHMGTPNAGEEPEAPAPDAAAPAPEDPEAQ